MSNNYPILYQNLLGMFPTEIEKKAFLWAADTRDETSAKYRAEAYAREVETLDVDARGRSSCYS